MHTCYSVSNNKVLNLGLSSLNHPTRLLLSLALQRCFSAEQMGTRPPLDEWSKYLYPLIQNITVGGQLSKFRGDWTLRSVVHVTVSDRAICSDQTLTCVRSSPTKRVWSAKCPYGCSLMLIEHRHPSVWSCTV